jgi:hypothetical protein
MYASDNPDRYGVPTIEKEDTLGRPCFSPFDVLVDGYLCKRPIREE